MSATGDPRLSIHHLEQNGVSGIIQIGAKIIF